MLSFRKKILFSDVILFLLFIALLFPFVGRTVGNIMRLSLETRAEGLITQLQERKNFSEMIQLLEDQRRLVFHQVALIDPAGRIFYATHGNDSIEQVFSADYELKHPEITQAIQSGYGYNTGYSDFYQEVFSYIAIRFEAGDQQYILRVGFPYEEVHSLTVDFEMGFLFLGAIILLLYSVMTWFIIHRLSQPIQQIIDAIVPYQEGQDEFLPKIVLDATVQSDEFGKLAFTLNSLSERIQKQIENLMRQTQETEDILESLSEGVIALDTSAKVTFANEVSCRMLQISHDAMIGQTLLQIPSQSPASKGLAEKCHEGVLHALQTSETIVQTWTFGTAKTIYLDLISAPLAHQSGAILVLQDKTSDYKVVEMGKDFIANASHELRTPITIIRGFAETLQDIPNLSQKMLHEITEKIVRTCGRLDTLVKSLLTLADIENLSEKRFHACDVSLLIENCKQMLLSVYPDVQIEMTNNCPRPIVFVDADLLDLAIMNLLENAVKYSQAPAHLSITIDKTGHDTVCIAIQDRGIGIPEKDLPHIFDRFYTVDKARSRKSGGTGLGLSIVKTIIDKHKGSVKVASQVGEGSCFTIMLPLRSV